MARKLKPDPANLNKNLTLRQNILSAASMVREYQRRFIQPYGLTPKQFEILRIISIEDKESTGYSILDIREEMNDAKPDTSRLVQRLVEKKLVQRKDCKEDKRFTRVFISDAGRDLLKDIDQRKSTLNQLTSHLSSDELSELNRLLNKLQGELDTGSRG